MKTLILAATAALLSTSAIAYPLVPGIDLSGGDFDDRRGVTVEQCKNLCTSSGKCKAFSYVYAKNWCFLKSSVGTAVSRDGVSSWVKGEGGLPYDAFDSPLSDPAPAPAVGEYPLTIETLSGNRYSAWAIVKFHNTSELFFPTLRVDCTFMDAAGRALQIEPAYIYNTASGGIAYGKAVTFEPAGIAQVNCRMTDAW